MEHAYGLYTHIQANKRRSIALLIGLFFLVYVMVFAGALAAEALMGDASLNYLIARARADFIAALPWATLGTVAWVLIAYKFHQSMIDAITGGREVTRREEPRLWNLLENLCISRGIPMPKLKVTEDEALNAFASGLNAQQYSVTVTRGLMQSLSDTELESVLGHELTHIRNGDVRMLVIAVVIAGVISFFGELVFRMFFYSGVGWRRRGGDDGERRGSGGALPALLIALALVAIAWLLSVVIRFALSRRREYLADAGSVELTKNPDAMISALRKIEGRGDLQRANSAVMEMCVDNPRHDFADLFDTHPPIDARVEALVKYAGGHDPGPIALAPPEEEAPTEAGAGAPAGGPWGEPEGAQQPSPWGAPAPTPETGQARPFLPNRPPVDLGASPPPAGPWGPRRDS
ncbi:MAG TPA: M48 family metalloprotease [Xanthobacteraceae bacterium]|nr:M48 family metalloprotease [Xanthobacteraceae bacterium]